MGDELSKRLVFSTIKPKKGMAAITKDSLTTGVNKSRIKTALENQTVKDLREFSQFFYVTNGEYRRLVEYFGKLFVQTFLAIPRAPKEMYESETFGNDIEKARLYLQNASVSEVNLEIATLVVRDGAFFGYERDMNGVIVMQPLPANYCRARFKTQGVFVPEFDMSYFDQFRTEKDFKEQMDAFPKEFAKYYNAYKADATNARWVMLDPTVARAHVMWNGIPFLAPIFTDILELKEYKDLEKIKTTLNLYKLLVQKIPVNKEGEITMLMPEIQDLHDNFTTMITNANVDVLTTPAEVEVIDLSDKGQTISDDMAKARDFLYSSAGTSSALFNSGSKTGSVGLDASVKSDESVMYPLLKQFERWYELKLSTIISQIPFTMMFLPITAHNRKEMVEMYKNLSSMGFPTRMMAATAAGLGQFDMDFMLNYENLFLKLPERMIATQSSFNSSGEGTPGAPTSDEPLSDEGQSAKDRDSNANRA